MKKVLSLIIALTLVFAVATPALAANPTGGETKITTSINETYTIIIPANKTIEFNAPSTALGDIGLTAAQLGPGRQVTFTADVSDAGVGALTNASSTDTIAYTLKLDGNASNVIGFTAKGTKTVTVDIAATAWAEAKAGSYSDTITFTVACVDIP